MQFPIPKQEPYYEQITDFVIIINKVPPHKKTPHTLV